MSWRKQENPRKLLATTQTRKSAPSTGGVKSRRKFTGRARQFVTETQSVRDNTDPTPGFGDREFVVMVKSTLDKLGHDKKKVTFRSLEVLKFEIDRYVVEIMEEAHMISDHCGNGEVELKDLQLVLKLRRRMMR